MAIMALVTLAAATQPQAVIRPAEIVSLSGRVVRLGDLARVSGVANAQELESRIVATLPESRRAVHLSRAAIAGLIRRSVPGLAVRGGPAALVIRNDQTPRTESRAEGCFGLSAAVAAGAVLRAPNLTPAVCAGGAREPSIRFDRRGGVVRAAAALSGGTYVGRISLPVSTDIERGQALTAVSTIGPVRVERRVVALQPARNGRRAFVRDEGGNVFAAAVSIAAGDRP